ncbi:MAG: hypothetical protein IT473_12700 [Lysobacter sp.]|nr:hypothetical protein [Lysobacter sp.]
MKAQSKLRKAHGLRRSVTHALLALGLTASTAALAWNSIDWTTILVTNYYSDASKIAIVGVEFAGECPHVPAPMIGEQTPYSDTQWIICKDVNQLDLPPY